MREDKCPECGREKQQCADELMREVGRYLGVVYDDRGYAIRQPEPRSLSLQERASILRAIEELQAEVDRMERKARHARMRLVKR